MKKIVIALGIFSFFSITAYSPSLSPHMDLIHAVKQLDYHKASQLLQEEEALPSELKNELLSEIDAIIEKEKNNRSWGTALTHLVLGLPLSLISLRFLKKAYEHNHDWDDSPKELASRFFKAQPTKVAAINHGGEVDSTNLPLVALSGALSALGIQQVFKGIAALFSRESKRYFKALAIKNLLENKIILIKKKKSVHWDPSILEHAVQ